MQLSMSILAILLSVVSATTIDCKNHPLLSPTACCKDKAPSVFNVTWLTTVGSITVHVETKWSPLGAERFYNLAKYDYFGSTTESGNANGFFRVVPGFVVQFGIAGNTSVSAAWENLNIKDDKVILSNIRGTIAYADAGADTRTTQVYINFANNSRLDAMGFTVFGTISEEDMLKVDKIYSGYQQDPDQDLIYSQGDAYLAANFPKLDYINKTTIITATSSFPEKSLLDQIAEERTVRKLTKREIDSAVDEEGRLFENILHSTVKDSTQLEQTQQPDILYPPFTPSPFVDVTNLDGTIVTLPVLGAPLIAFAYNQSDSWTQSVWADNSDGLLTRGMFLQDTIFSVAPENATRYLFMSFDEKNAATDAGMMHDLLVAAMTSLNWNSSFQNQWLSRAIFSKEPVSKLGANGWVASLLSNWTNSDVLPPPIGKSGCTFSVSSSGILLETGWLEGRPTMQTLSWAAQWLDFEMRTQANLTATNSAGEVTIVPVFDHSLMIGYPGVQAIVEIPASSSGSYNHLEVEMMLGCPTPWDNSCAIWDRQAQVLVCCNGNVSDPTCGGVNQELARWITPFRRGIGHWITDVSPLLPLLVGDQSSSTAVKCSFTMATDAWAMPWYPSLFLRLSTIPNAPLSSKQIVPLWNTGAGGNGGENWGCVFDQKYNDGTCFPNRTVSIPSGATRAHIHSVITGHGSDNNNCAEFCATSHVITVNNEHIHEETFDNAGTNVGCTLATLSGALPNEHGTWPYGRDGWCDGSAVRPWIFEITNDIDFSSNSFDVSYKGLFNGETPNPNPQTNMPYMIVHIYVSFS
jgi:cyclophilin family peptidyl-prolyl cis-trans isomerase